MSTKNPCLLRVIAVGAGAALTLGVATGVAAAQTGSLESGFGLDVESVLSPAGELLPEPGSLDEAVSAAHAGSEVGSSDARGEAQRALPPPSGSGSAGGGDAGGGDVGDAAVGGSASGGGSAGGGVTGVPGAGSLDPIQPGLGAGAATDPGSPIPGVLGSGSADADRPGAGTDTAAGAALTALIAMTAGQHEGGPGPAQLPPLPPPR